MQWSMPRFFGSVFYARDRPLRLAAKRASFGPRGSTNHMAEIGALEGRVLVGKNVGFDVAEGRLRLVLDAIIEGLDDVFLEVNAARMRVDNRLSLGIAVFGVGQAEHVHFDAGCH